MPADAAGTVLAGRTITIRSPRPSPIVGDRYRTPDGWAVEVVGLSATPDRNDGERLKVTYCGFFGESSGIAVDGRGPHV